jgi:phosphoribosylamine--glycine ligase
MPGVRVYQAGTRLDGDRLLSAGGRVLNVTAVGATPAEAQDPRYAAVDRIDWPEGLLPPGHRPPAVERERG